MSTTTFNYESKSGRVPTRARLAFLQACLLRKFVCLAQRVNASTLVNTRTYNNRTETIPKSVLKTAVMRLLENLKRSTFTYGDENRIFASSPSFFTTSDDDERTTSGILYLDAQISSVV
jgi:hypothetical protein